jgi:hypothetical protein
MIKLDKKYLEEMNSIDISHYLGDWINDPDTDFLMKFQNAEPFEHIIIPNFLNNNYANNISDNFPNNYETWHKYCNPLEVKYSFDNINELHEDLKNYFYLLSTDKMVQKMAKITNIPNLTYDDYLHGAGLHSHTRNGKLNMHLDYEKHPISGLQRRLNIILYMNKEWNPEWNGATELWNENMTKCITKSDVKFNTAIIFKTNEISWHGVPDKILCPENVYRKTLAYYYMSPLENKENKYKIGNDGSGYRTKATFVKRPNDPFDEGLQKLFDIRSIRRIEDDDMAKIYPEWKI